MKLRELWLNALWLSCTDSKDVAAATKKQPNKGGIYFPIAACQVSMRQRVILNLFMYML